MLKVTVEFPELSRISEGVICLKIEKVLRTEFPALDVRVYKARMADDSLLRIKRTA